MGIRSYIILIAVLILASVALLFLDQLLEDTGGKVTVNATLANPASVYCKEQGGVLGLRTDESGQYGVCILPNGTECEEWVYYKGECP